MRTNGMSRKLTDDEMRKGKVLSAFGGCVLNILLQLGMKTNAESIDLIGKAVAARIADLMETPEQLSEDDPIRLFIEDRMNDIEAAGDPNQARENIREILTEIDQYLKTGGYSDDAETFV